MPDVIFILSLSERGARSRDVRISKLQIYRSNLALLH